jgi:hypothetical protein
MSYRSKRRVVCTIIAVWAFALCAVSAAKAQGTGGAVAPEQVNPNVTISINAMQLNQIGSIATFWDGSAFVDCDNCGEIATIIHGSSTYYKLVKTGTEQFLTGTYVYQQVNAGGNFVWKGKTLIGNDWAGGKLNSKLNLVIGRRHVKLRLVTLSASLHDSTKPELPTKSVCDPKVMECMKAMPKV